MFPLVDHIVAFKTAQEAADDVDLQEAIDAVAALEIMERETTYGWGHGHDGLGGFGDLSVARRRLQHLGMPLTDEEYAAFKKAVIRYGTWRPR